MIGHIDETALYNPFLFVDIPSAILSCASYLYLTLGLFYKLSDWVQFSFLGNDVDQYNRGDSLLLYYQIEGDSFFNKPNFRQVFFEPILIGLIGCSLILIDMSLGLGVFFLVGASFYFIDEYIYHNAKELKFGKGREGIRKGKKTIKKHEEMDIKSNEDDFYTFS